MVNSINSVVETNISAIESYARSASKDTKFLELEGIFDSSVGAGWATIKSGQSKGVFWLPELFDATVRIKADGKGGWYVLTAYPGR